jgi:hypothetical protein
MLKTSERRYFLSTTKSHGMTYHAVGLAGRYTTQMRAMAVRIDIRPSYCVVTEYCAAPEKLMGNTDARVEDVDVRSRRLLVHVVGGALLPVRDTGQVPRGITLHGARYASLRGWRE